MRILVAVLTGLMALVPVVASADTFTDDFSAGINAGTWNLNTNQPLYSTDATQGDIRFGKPAGGSASFQAINMDLICDAQGNFDIRVDFRNASINRVNGTPANQVQLNVSFGGQLFALVRDDDIVAGDNCHVYADPPRNWFGARPTTASQGTFRIVRNGAVVSGYFNGTLIHAATYNTSPATRIWFSLQNNGTVDATSVTFDNFSITADHLVCPAGSVGGQVLASCPAPDTPLQGVTVDLYEVGSGNLAGSAVTEIDGSYDIPDIQLGDYILTVVTPLGYMVTTPEFPVHVAGSAFNQDVSLDCLPIADDAYGMGFWKKQVAVATGANGHAQIDGATLCSYLDLIEAHFNSNALNQVVVYNPPVDATCTDKLLVARDLLNLKGNAGMTARARQHLMSLLLNVAGNYLSLRKSVSVDGATVSQAITYCDQLLDDANLANDELAKDISESVNNGTELSAGVIPLSTDDIAYAPIVSRPGYAFELAGAYPNPFNPRTTVRYSIASAGHVWVRIYDVRGVLVRTLVDANQSPGEHAIEWNGTDENGAAAASGVYLLRLQSGGLMHTRKIALLK